MFYIGVIEEKNRYRLVFLKFLPKNENYEEELRILFNFSLTEIKPKVFFLLLGDFD